MDQLLKKLNYKKGIVQILNAPAEFNPVIEAWKAECEVVSAPSVAAMASVASAAGAKPAVPADFFIFFVASAAEAAKLAVETTLMVGPATVFWVAYPKQTSKRYKADINRDTLWPILESFGYRPNRQVAIDEDWSALRFAKT